MSRKKEGIVGRSSKRTVEKRRRICLELYYSRPDLPRGQFIAEYSKILHIYKMDVPKEQTLINDTKELKLHFKNILTTSDPTKTTFRNMGNKIKYCLRQIRIECNHIDMVLYDSDVPFNITSENDFSKPLDQLKNIYKDNTDFTAITDTSLVCLSFILHEKGFETYIEDIFNKYLKIICNYLYSETHSYCTKIFFEYQRLDWIMKYIYQTVSELTVYD